MADTDIYNFSYTGFSLRINETCKVANAIFNNEDFDAVEEIGGGKTSTTKKFLNEINKRLATLTDSQLSFLVNGDLVTQKQVAFLSVCKVHHFIRDFVVEVLREKILVFDYEITQGDYLSFLRSKSDLHPEMDTLTDNTLYKIKQVAFRIFEEAGIINNAKEKIIQPQILDDKLVSSLVDDNKSLLTLFLWSDLDIENVSR